MPEPERFFWNRGGEPISLAVWFGLFRDLGYRVVEETIIHGGHGCVCTVWLGFDSRFDAVDAVRKSERSEGFIFETVVAMEGNAPKVERHRSEEEAVRFHRYMVQEFEEVERARLRRLT